MVRIGRDRRYIHKQLVEDVIASDKMQPGCGAGNLPSFILPREVSGQYGLVHDFRPFDLLTVKDGNPLPRIAETVQLHSESQMLSKLD